MFATRKTSQMLLTIEEKKLKEIISDIVKETAERILMTEMAFSLSSYKNKVEDRIDQLITNWCLVRYTRYDEKFIKLRTHWSVELIALMNDIRQMRLKKGDNIETKQNALYYVWSEYEFDRDETMIDNTISLKFEKEGINTQSEWYINTVSDCKNATRDIVNALLSDSKPKIMKYVRSIAEN